MNTQSPYRGKQVYSLDYLPAIVFKSPLPSFFSLLKNVFSTTGTIRVYACLAMLFTIVLSIPKQVDAQKRQLTVSDKVIKIAMVDQDSVRKAYKAFFTAKQKNVQAHIASKVALDKSLQSLDKRTRESLRKDSLKGAKARDQINRQADSEKSQLMLAYQQEQKKRHEERITMMTGYESKITQAIQAVVVEGGFTSVEPMPKGGKSALTDNKRRIDVTDLIIKKLN